MRVNGRALLYYAVASVNVLSTLLPVWPGRLYILARWLHLPVAIILGAQDITLCAGVAMLLLAYPAARRHRRAAYTMMFCAVLAIASNLVKGLDIEEALLDALLLAALWRSRRGLLAFPTRYTLLDALRLALTLLVVVKLYGLLGHAILARLRALVPEPLEVASPLDRLRFLLTAKLGLESLWFHQSQVLLPIFLVLVFVVISATSVISAASPSDREALYERFGRASHNSLAYLARRNDVQMFVDPAGHGAISYRQVGRVALQIGAIMAPAEARAGVFSAYYAWCRVQHLIPCAVALAPDERPAARAAGMRTLTLGSEAIVGLAEFRIERLSKKLRWARRSLGKRGYRVALLSAADIGPAMRARLDRLDVQWYVARGGQDHGCCMTLGRFPAPDEPECLIGLMYDRHDEPVAYLTLLPSGDGYYSLDLTRRAAGAPNAATEFLIMGVLSELQARGASAVSLNFSTLSWLKDVPAGRRAWALVGAAFQLGSLEAFNNKFRPRWVPRYLAFPSWRTLPDVIYAMLILEGMNRMARNALVRAAQRWSVAWPATPRATLAHEGA